MLVSDFDFDLPEELIAQEAAPRGQSRLLAVDRSTGDLKDGSITDLPDRLQPGDLLVVNNTRVFAARLIGRRVPSGGVVECLLLREESPGVWMALMHPGQKLKPGARVRFEGVDGTIDGEVLDRHFFGRRTVRLEGQGGELHDLIDRLGHIPLPPYIKRLDTLADRDRYQTVFAAEAGAVAAPTAALHFSEALFARLAAAGVERTFVTLHVGVGTFKPVTADRLEDHAMHAESYTITREAADAINRARSDGRRVIAVGTTSARVLETQPSDAALRATRGQTQIFIHPPYRWRHVDALITNFHLPRSTLIALVAAMIGLDEQRRLYEIAIENRYRFFSYGDGMFVE